MFGSEIKGHNFDTIYPLLTPCLLQYSIALSKGLPIDISEVDRLTIELNRSKGRSRRIARRTFGDINLNSNMQVNKKLIALYGKGLPLGPPAEKTKKRSPLYNNKNDYKVEYEFPKIKTIATYKKILKKMTYISKKGDSSLLGENYHEGKSYPSLSIMGQNLSLIHI